jgi:hypothetical protein
MDVPFFGECACGAVRYECSAAPVAMVNCHCRDCQRAGGAGFSPTVVVPAGSFRLLPRSQRTRGACFGGRTHKSALG